MVKLAAHLKLEDDLEKLKKKHNIRTYSDLVNAPRGIGLLFLKKVWDAMELEPGKQYD